MYFTFSNLNVEVNFRLEKLKKNIPHGARSGENNG